MPETMPTPFASLLLDEAVVEALDAALDQYAEAERSRAHPGPALRNLWRAFRKLDSEQLDRYLERRAPWPW